MKIYIFLCLLCCVQFLSAQQRLQILDKATDLPVEGVVIKDVNSDVLSVSDYDGFFSVDIDVKEIFLEHDQYPPQIFQLPLTGNKLLLDGDLVNLRTLNIRANDDRALALVKKVIEKQPFNSPKSLESFELKSYTKFWVDAEGDSISFIPEPRTKEDSAQNNAKKLLENSMFFLSERAVTHYFDKSKGEKNIVEAARVSGVQTPLYELVSLQPVSVEFNQKEFDFFFRKFINPLSAAGLKSFNFIISDTLIKNGEPVIQLNFNSKKKEKKSLNGIALIDAKTFALTRFYGENQTATGSDTFIEVEYKKYKSVWIPEYQIFKFESNNTTSYVYQDSITPGGETVRKKVIKKGKTWMNARTSFFDFSTPLITEKNVFGGVTNEVPKNAFSDFDRRIQSFRTDGLTDRELQTYVKIDSIGKAEKIDRYIKIFRVLSQEGWLSVGHVDLDLKEIYSGNAYEDFRFGLSSRTNHKFHPKLSLNGRLYYGTRDNAFKYGAGAAYMVFPSRQGKVFVDYSDDIAAAGRFRNPIYTFEEAFLWMSEQSANPFFVDENKISAGYEQDISRNIKARLTFTKTPQEALFDYSFDGNDPSHKYNFSGIQLALRYAPNEEFTVSPIGKFRIKRSKPVYKVLVNQGLNIFNGEQKFTRVQLNADFSWNIFASPTFFNLRAGKVFGDVPLWQYFDGGGKSRNHEGFWQRMRFGGTQIFETMMPGEFISDQFVFANAKQQLLDLKFGKSYNIPVSAVYKIGTGRFKNMELHSGLNFNEMYQPYQEIGLEFDKVLLNLMGIGVYYRLGAHQFDDFDRNISVKAVLNLSNL